nr:MAG TPA: hypothetical protein [Inoviridae sp.]
MISISIYGLQNSTCRVILQCLASFPPWGCHTRQIS